METKKQFRYFSIMDHKKEEDYLRRMHRNGWKFLRVGGIGIYHFEECQPEDVVYQLDYPENKGEKDEYVKMFSDCGWEYSQDYADYSYFRKPASEMKGEETIFNDAESKVAMMERVYKGRLRPLLVLLCAVLIPQFIIQMATGNYGIAALFGGILALYLLVFVWFGVNYHRTKRK